MTEDKGKIRDFPASSEAPEKQAPEKQESEKQEPEKQGPEKKDVKKKKGIFGNVQKQNEPQKPYTVKMDEKEIERYREIEEEAKTIAAEGFMKVLELEKVKRDYAMKAHNSHVDLKKEIEYILRRMGKKKSRVLNIDPIKGEITLIDK